MMLLLLLLLLLLVQQVARHWICGYCDESLGCCCD
jgi:hypothetical protein